MSDRTAQRRRATTLSTALWQRLPPSLFFSVLFSKTRSSSSDLFFFFFPLARCNLRKPALRERGRGGHDETHGLLSRSPVLTCTDTCIYRHVWRTQIYVHLYLYIEYTSKSMDAVCNETPIHSQGGTRKIEVTYLSLYMSRYV